MGRTKTARTNLAAVRPPVARRRLGMELHESRRGANGRAILNRSGSANVRRRVFVREIIDTAVRLFRKRGYAKTRIDDIVQSLEISQPTFFRYFPSKRRGFGRSREAGICLHHRALEKRAFQ